MKTLRKQTTSEERTIKAFLKSKKAAPEPAVTAAFASLRKNFEDEVDAVSSELRSSDEFSKTIESAERKVNAGELLTEMERRVIQLMAVSKLIGLYEKHVTKI